MKIDIGKIAEKDPQVVTKNKFGDVAWKLVNTINHSIIAIVSFYTCWLALTSKTVGLFELHIALPTIGYQFLMAETILTLSGENSWTSTLDKSTKKTIHGVLAGTGSILAVAGTSLIIYSKSGQMHFTSPHAILGLTAMIFVLITFICGPVTYFAPMMKLKRPVFIKIYHNFTASLGFIFGITSLCLGYQKSWFKKQTSPEFVICFIVFSSLSVFLTLRVPILNTYRHVKGIFSR